MAYRFAGQNKAVNYELATNNSAYQQQVALYDALVNVIRRDRRFLADPDLRDDISRAQNLLHAESTSLFKPSLDRVQGLITASPDLTNISYEDLRKALTSPNSGFDSQKKIISGWHKAEVHHMTPAALVAKQLSLLPYSQWGTVLHNTAKNVPITSSAFNGVENRSTPGHNISHLDVFGGQFYKGDSVDNASIILPGGHVDDMVDQLTDTAQAARFISEVGGMADKEVFLPVMAEALSKRVGRKVDPSEIGSTLISPNGRGRTVAAELKAYTNQKLVDEVEKEAYGAKHTEGASNWLNANGVGILKTADELREMKNARRRQGRKSEVPIETTATLRPDIGQVLKDGGMNADKILSILLT